MTNTVEDAVNTLEVHLRDHPDDVEALHDLSIIYQRSGANHKALEAAHRVTQLAPDLAEGWLNYGNLKMLVHDEQEAIATIRTATDLAPQDALAWYNLGNILAQRRQRADGIEALEKAHGLAPSNVDVLASLGLAYRKQNRLSDAIAVYTRALAVDPGNARIRSNLLVALQYEPGATDHSLCVAHKKWEKYVRTGTHEAMDTIDPNHRPLRVGYVSGNFRRHPIGFFLSGILTNHRSSEVTAVCLSDTKSPDAYTDAIKDAAALWIDTRTMNEETFFDTVRDNGIDILVDLSCHLSHSRLQTFARRGAPVQVTWAGYVGTTGLSNRDWLIADRHHAPDGYEQWASERIIRLPHDYVCYAPPSSSPPVSDLPCVKSEYVTFGCFNNLVKINANVIAM